MYTIEDIKKNLISAYLEVKKEVHEDKELMQIIDEAIDEIENNEINEETLSKFKELEQMGVSNEQLYKAVLDINSTLLTAKREELKLDNTILRAIENNAKISNIINEKYNKTTAILFALMFITGVLIGINSQYWLPHLKEFLDVAKTIVSVAK